MAAYLMGIDGGGSTVRVVIVDTALTILAHSEGLTVNPSVVGPEKALQRIQATMQTVIEQADISPGDIAAVGIGVAGALPDRSTKWLQQVVSPITPKAQIAIGLDPEIALTGAHGDRRGVLILAGTGSAAFGVNASGKSAKVGGWGYLMGDEGSGFWLGIRALQAVMRAGDGRDRATVLTERVFAALKVRTLEDAAMWLYSPEKPPAREVAWLAPIVIEEAEANDVVAVELVETAAQELALLGQTVIRQLEIENPRIAFAGGLLESDHILTRRLCALLGLSERPTPRYPPVIGAAILAQLAIESQENLAG